MFGIRSCIFGESESRWTKKHSSCRGEPYLSKKVWILRKRYRQERIDLMEWEHYAEQTFLMHANQASFDGHRFFALCPYCTKSKIVQVSRHKIWHAGGCHPVCGSCARALVPWCLWPLFQQPSNLPCGCCHCCPASLLGHEDTFAMAR